MSDEYWAMNVPICPNRKGKIVCPHCGKILNEVLEVRKETLYMEFPVEYDEETGHYGHYGTGHEIHHGLEQITEHRCPNCDGVIAESEDELEKLKDPLRFAVASSAGTNVDRETKEVARKLRGLKRFRIQIMASGTFEVTAETRKEAERKARTQFDWSNYLDNFELVEVEGVEG